MATGIHRGVTGDRTDGTGIASSPVDPVELRRAGEALLELVPPAERRLVLIAFENLVDIHAAGRVRLTKIDGPTNLLRKAIRGAWRSGVLTPLAKSRDARVRSLLSILPDTDPLTGHAEISLRVAEAATGHAMGIQGVAAHLAKAQSLAEAIPVILAALDALVTMPRVFVKDGKAPPRDDRSRFALLRLRQAFERGVASLAGDVATVAHKESLAGGATSEMRRTAGVLAEVPPGGIRLRDPGGAEWTGRLASAIAVDVLNARADKAVERLFKRYPGIVLDKAAVRRVGRLGARFDVHLSYADVGLTLAYLFDIEAGSIGSEARGTGPAGERTSFRVAEVDAFLDAHRPREGTPAARKPPVRRCGPRIRAGAPDPAGR